MPAPRLEFRHVTRSFARARGREEVIVAVADVSFSVADGEVVSLIGPSGCGKSTLLNLGSGLDQPTQGEVFVDGERVTKPNPHVAFMLQKDLLLPWRTIRENVEFGLEIQGRAVPHPPPQPSPSRGEGAHREIPPPLRGRVGWGVVPRIADRRHHGADR